MTGGSNPSWTTRWIIFIDGWWKFWPKGIPALSVNTLTACPLARTNVSSELSLARCTVHKCKSNALLAIAISLAIFASICVPGTSAQTKHRISAKHKAVPCRTGCKPDTSAPDVATSSTGDASAQKELSELARNLRNAAPGAYDKLSSFAKKHPSDIWGARAALALGYDDYQKNKAQQALGWLNKAKGDTLLREYVLFWTAQANRALK